MTIVEKDVTETSSRATGTFRVLASDPLTDGWQEVLTDAAGVSVEINTGLSEAELVEIIGQFDGLIVRSGTQVTRKVIEAAGRLRVIGRAGVGVDNIDVDAATERGIVVANAPGGNTVSTAEHSVSMLLSLSRHIPQATASIRAGHWNRKAFTGVEVYGKTLGVIGVGRVGQEVVVRARSFGMKILGYDPFLSDSVAEQLRVTLATLDEIFEQADYITLHTPLTKDTRHLISEAQLKRCKKGVRIINCARGGLVDEAALADAIRSGHVAGAALDVFEEEPPPKDHPLLALDDVICTPHLGAYTTEAQEQVTRQIAEQVLDALNGQPVPNAVNMPSIDPQLFDAIRPYLMLAERIGSLMVQLSRGRLQRISIEYQGEILEYATSPMTASLLKGAIAELTDDPVTMVNAPLFARKRGVQIDEVRSGHHPDYANLMTVSCETDEGSSSYMATIFGRQDVRLVRMDGFEVKAKLEGDMLFCCNEDAPGVVGWMGTLLSDAGVNIADMALGRERRGGRAIMVLNIDAPVPDEAMEKIRSVEHVLWATQVTI